MGRKNDSAEHLFLNAFLARLPQSPETDTALVQAVEQSNYFPPLQTLVDRARLDEKLKAGALRELQKKRRSIPDFSAEEAAQYGTALSLSIQASQAATQRLGGLEQTLAKYQPPTPDPEPEGIQGEGVFLRAHEMLSLSATLHTPDRLYRVLRRLENQKKIRTKRIFGKGRQKGFYVNSSHCKLLGIPEEEIKKLEGTRVPEASPIQPGNPVEGDCSSHPEAARDTYLKDYQPREGEVLLSSAEIAGYSTRYHSVGSLNLKITELAKKGEIGRVIMPGRGLQRKVIITPGNCGLFKIPKEKLEELVKVQAQPTALVQDAGGPPGQGREGPGYTEPPSLAPPEDTSPPIALSPTIPPDSAGGTRPEARISRVQKPKKLNLRLGSAEVSIDPTAQYSSEQAAGYLGKIHPGYFTQPTVQAILNEQGLSKEIPGERLHGLLASFQSGVFDLSSSSSRRLLEGRVEASFSQIEAALRSPELGTFVHTPKGINRPYVKTVDFPQFIAALVSRFHPDRNKPTQTPDLTPPRRQEEEDPGDFAEGKIERELGAAMSRLLEKGICPRGGVYDALRKRKVLDTSSVPTIRSSFERYSQGMSGYRFCQIVHFQMNSGIGWREFQQRVAPLVEQGILRDIIADCKGEGEPLYVLREDFDNDKLRAELKTLGILK